MSKVLTESSQGKSAVTPDENDAEDGVRLIDFAIVLAKYKKSLIGIPVIAGILAVVIVLNMDNVYTATTKILPPQQNQSSAASMLAQLGGLAGAAGGALGIRTPSDIYVAMLRSRTLADAIIQRFGLNEYFHKSFQSDTRQALQNVTRVRADRDGTITVEVDSKEPKHAAELANAYIDELHKLSSSLAVTEASQRRLFFERQLAQARENLAKAEVNARRSIEKSGLAQVESQGRTMLETTARLRAQITVKEIQIGAMRAFAAAANPELIRAQQEIDVMKRELARIEGGGFGGGAVGRSGESKSGIDGIGALRDIKYYETIYELLAKQYELARLDEAKDSALIQVLDMAIPPDRKSGPNRRQFVTMSLVAAFFLSLLWVLIRESVSRIRNDPGQAERIREFRQLLRW